MSKIDEGFETVKKETPAAPLKKEHPAIAVLKEKAVFNKKVAPKDTAPIFLKDMKDKELAAMLETVGPGFHKMAGYLNHNKILFPVYMRTKKFHIAYTGDVVVNLCLLCGHRNSGEEALKGMCSNQKVKPLDEPCGYNAIEELEEITDPKELLDKLI